MIPPKLLQSMEILTIPIADLQAKIAAELEKNPFLELKDAPDDRAGPPDETPAGE